MKAKQRPILESMVDVILSGGKTQFRTVINPQPAMYEPGQCNGLSDTICDALACPHGKTGDILWVLEDHYQYGHWEEDKSKSLKHGKTAWKFVADTSVSPRYGNDAPDQFKYKRCPIDPETPAWYKGSALFMPKSIARIWMEIVSIDVQRVQINRKSQFMTLFLIILASNSLFGTLWFWAFNKRIMENLYASGQFEVMPYEEEHFKKVAFHNYAILGVLTITRLIFINF